MGMPIKILRLCFVVSFLSTLSKCEQVSYELKPLADTHSELGEGPHWDVETQSLYFVDVNAGQINRFCYTTQKVYKAQIEGTTLASFIIPVEGNANFFAVGSGRSVIIVKWDGFSETAQVFKTLFKVQQNDERFEGNRFNDGKCDLRGRLFAGTMRYVGNEMEFRYGALYKYDNGKVELLKTNVGISNGMAWNYEENKFYYIDTADLEVKEYDYELQNGTISEPRVVFGLKGNSTADNLFPDGMTIDTKGNIYVAAFNGNAIYKVDPRTSEVLMKIKFHDNQLTSAAFGGPNLDVLFVTTASRGGLPKPAGQVFTVTGLGAKGYPMNKIHIENTN